MAAHSPLGASSAARWLNCPGSVALVAQLADTETDEPDYTKEGTAAHEVAATCLRNGGDAWEKIGQTMANGLVCSPDMATAVQYYLDFCRQESAGLGVQKIIEERITFDDHADGFGTVDFAVIDPEFSLIKVIDYKHGVGIVVEVERNPQLMYYAYGLLQKYPDVRDVNLSVVQPRAAHAAQTIRTWGCKADEIIDWAQSTLIPGMIKTEQSTEFHTGEWCRFCPAKLVCPKMLSDFTQMAQAPSPALSMTDEALGDIYQKIASVQMYIKAVEDEAFRRQMAGKDVPGTKLVAKRANRVWKDKAEAIFAGRFGEAAFAPAFLKSPAAMEKIGPQAAELVKEWAYTPDAGYTLALATDKRPAVKLPTGPEVFGDVELPEFLNRNLP